MRARQSVRRWVHLTVISVTASLFGGLLVAPPAGAAIEPCTTPPAVFPIGNLTAGMMATGWTVLQGTTPESFDVEVLGVLQDAIAPGYDLILIKASGANIDAIGGMGPGFSGSPVYRNGKLVGSVSYGLGGDAHYGALTPGQALVDVLNNPGRSVLQKRTVQLSRADRRLVASDAGIALTDVSSSLTEIPTPLAVTGASDERMNVAAARLERSGATVIPYRASSTTSSPDIMSGDPMEPGDVFTAALSYGAISYAGVGTATIVCGDYVVAFGHAFRHTGGRTDGAVLGGEIVATIPPGTGFSYPYPFKIANLGGLEGTLDQDRLSGVRGIMGRRPGLTEITSTVTNLDTDRTFEATTQVAVSSWVRFVAYDHVYEALYAALDARRGVSHVTWTVSGRSDGDPFTFQISNDYVGYRVFWGPAYDVYTSLRSLRNAIGNAHVRAIHMDASVTESHDYALIHKIRSQSSTEPGFDVRPSIKVAPGDTLDVRVPVQHVLTDEVRFATASFVVPNSVRGRGELEAYARRAYFYIRNPGTIDQLIAKFAKIPRGNDLTILMRMRGMNHPLRTVVSMPWALKGDADDVELRLA
jgi:hypothetical protein